jgi:hypothetical protein
MLTPTSRNALGRELGTGPAKEIGELLDLFAGPGTTWYVSSTRGNSSFSGRTWNDPLATITQALTVCSAGDTILLDYSHNEGLGSGESINFNKAGVKVIGMGSGTLAPRIDFDHASATIDVTASSVTLQNIRLLPSVATVSIGIDVNAAVTNTRLINIEILDGEDGAGTDEFVLGVDIKAGCTRTYIDGMIASQHASADGATHVVKLTGASDKVTIKNSWMYTVGTAAVACIGGDTTLSTNLLVEDCILTTDAEPGIEVLTGTTGVFRNVDIFTNLATIAAATVADGVAHFRVRYVELGNESDAAVKTASVDD